MSINKNINCCSCYTDSYSSYIVGYYRSGTQLDQGYFQIIITIIKRISRTQLEYKTDVTINNN